MPAKRMSKTELVEAIASQSGVEKKQVNAVLDSLNSVVYKELKAENEVVIPGLLKLVTVKKPAGLRLRRFNLICSNIGKGQRILRCCWKRLF